MSFLLASTHAAPPDIFVVDGSSNNTDWWVKQAEAGSAAAIALLARAGIVKHYLLDEDRDRILGVTWRHESDGWHEVQLGTEAERAAALASQEHLRLRKEVWPVQDKQRRIREANAVLNNPDSTAMQRTEALQALNAL